MSMQVFLAGIFKGTLVQLFLKIVVRGNAVQISLTFPAKRLSIYRKHFSSHLVNDLIEIQLTN